MGLSNISTWRADDLQQNLQDSNHVLPEVRGDLRNYVIKKDA